MPTTLALEDHAGRDDLRTYLERLAAAGLPEVRLVTRGAVLAVFGCTQAPEGLSDPTPAVLVMRSFALAGEPVEPVDAVVPARALLDRLARMGLLGLALELPEAEVTAAWAGVLPPAGGWEPRGLIDGASLSRVAEEGAGRIAEALPDSPGEAVVRRVRASVWGAEIAPGIPAAAAFAAEAMGFLAGAPTVRVSATRTWYRLSTAHGEVLIRSPLG